MQEGYFKRLSDLDNLCHIANYAMATYAFAAGVYFYAQGGLYKMFYFLYFIGAYPVSAFMVGIFVLLLDRRDRRTAILYLIIWQALANLLPLPSELFNAGAGITVISLAKTEGSLCYESILLFIGVGMLKVFDRIPKVRPTKEMALLAAVLVLACLSDSYHEYSTVLAYWLLITEVPVSPRNPRPSESSGLLPLPSEEAERGR